jgi:hypothetical protein
MFAINGSHPDGPRGAENFKIGWRNALNPSPKWARQGSGKSGAGKAGCEATLISVISPLT